MATLLGTDTQQRQVSLKLASSPNGQLFSGDIREFFGTYTCTGAEAAADVIPLIKLPIGAILRVSSIRISTDAIGGTGFLIDSIGDAGSATRYSTTDIPLTAAQTETAATPTNANAVAPFQIDTDANATILAVLGATSGNPTAGKKITVRGSYRLP